MSDSCSKQAETDPEAPSENDSEPTIHEAEREPGPDGAVLWGDEIDKDAMKYFTYDLLKRYGSPDERIADAADREWERATVAYRKRLETIRPKLPAAVRSFLQKFCLHDARLVTLARGKPLWTLSLVFQFDSPHQDGIQLIYTLPKGLRALYHRGREEAGVHLEWLYDEIDVVRNGATPLFLHSILLTAGLELQLSFSRLQWKYYPRMVAPPAKPMEREQIKELVGMS